MVAISFSVFKDKILNSTKTQTIRPFNPKRYEQIKKIGKLQLYWKQRTKECRLLKEVELEDIFVIAFTGKENYIGIYEVDGTDIHFVRYATEEEVKEIVRRDGFKNFLEMYNWFAKKYKSSEYSGLFGMYFMVIRWK